MSWLLAAQHGCEQWSSNAPISGSLCNRTTGLPQHRAFILQCAAHALTRWMLVLQRGGQPAVMLRGHSLSLGFSMAYSEPRTLAQPAGTEAAAAVQASSRASRGSSQRRVPLMAPSGQWAGGGVHAVLPAGLAAGSSACQRYSRLSPHAIVTCKAAVVVAVHRRITAIRPAGPPPYSGAANSAAAARGCKCPLIARPRPIPRHKTL